MGVAGLHTWMRANQSELSKKIDLYQTKLIIDANRLIYSIYAEIYSMDPNSKHFRHDIYGGDLILYAKVVRQFFGHLKKCSVEPILIYDGSVISKRALLPLNALWISELKRRGLDQLTKIKTSDESSQALDRTSSIIKNHLLDIVFRNIALEFGARQIVAAYEADVHIVELANLFNCPVLTNDTDFLMFPLKVGWIYFDKISIHEFIEIGNDETKIRCSLYNQEQFVKHFPKLDTKTLPLLSALFTYGFQTEVIENVVKALRLTQRRSYYPLRTRSRQQQQMVNFINWLRGVSLQEAKRRILLQIFGFHKRQFACQVIDAFIERFNIDNHISLKEVLSNIYPLKSSNSGDAIFANLDKNKVSKPVEFLIDQLEKGSLTCNCLDIIYENIQYSYSILDDTTLPTACLVIQRPYKLALVLLRASVDEQKVYKYYDREEQNYTLFTLKPLEELEGYGTLNKLDCYSMLDLDEEARKSLLSNCFNFDDTIVTKIHSIMKHLFEGDFINEASLCFSLVLRYIASVNNTRVRKEFLQALLLTILYYAILEDKLNCSTFSPEESRDYQMILVEHLEPHTIMRNNLEYLPNDQSLYKRIMHYIIQLQLTYKAYNLISCLTQSSNKPRHERFFNSTLIFRLTKLLILGNLSFDNLLIDLPEVIDDHDALVELSNLD